VVRKPPDLWFSKKRVFKPRPLRGAHVLVFAFTFKPTAAERNR